MYRTSLLELVDELLPHFQVVCGAQDIVHKTTSDDLASRAIFFDEYATVSSQSTKAEVVDQVVGILEVPRSWRAWETVQRFVELGNYRSTSSSGISRIPRAFDPHDDVDGHGG